MTYFLTDRIPAFALLLGLMAVPAWADDDKNESGKGNKRSAEAHQRDGERRAINPRDSLGSKESLEGHNRRSHEPGDRTYEDRRMREHREGIVISTHAALQKRTLEFRKSPSVRASRASGLAQAHGGCRYATESPT